MDVQGSAQELFLSDVHGEYDTFARAVAELAGPQTRIHMVGDVYDRGPAPDAVMDALADLPNCDIQWGNHDILWMGAAAGQPGCVANVVRICARYGNLDVLEQTYGISLDALRAFANEAYAGDPCAAFGLKGFPALDASQVAETMRIQKAMAIIQFKAEARLIEKYPEFGLQSRNLLGKIDFAAGTVELDGVVHPLLDTVFPTVDAACPYAWAPGEEEALDALCVAFRENEKLQRHMSTFLQRGSLYKVEGNVLLFHACVPLNEDGTFKQTTLFGETYAGRALFDKVDALVRDAFLATTPEDAQRGADTLWYLWLGQGSPLFAKSKMATFELYYVEDKAARKEAKNAFYALLDDETVVACVLNEFGVSPEAGRIVCGHVPIKVAAGESPLRCGGRVLMIDGGMSRPYRANTGLGGMALVCDEGGLRLGEFGTDAGAAGLSATWLAV